MDESALGSYHILFYAQWRHLKLNTGILRLSSNYKQTLNFVSEWFNFTYVLIFFLLFYFSAVFLSSFLNLSSFFHSTFSLLPVFPSKFFMSSILLTVHPFSFFLFFLHLSLSFFQKISFLICLFAWLTFAGLADSMTVLTNLKTTSSLVCQQSQWIY
jgi:hypothetical protein